MNIRYLLLIAIVTLAAVLRLYRLPSIPPGVNRDEASIGVTAKSLATTGKDEYGRFLPISFESFGDWKLPLYIYTAVPFVQIFGLSEIAVRLPSALAGIMTVLCVYYLSKILLGIEAVALLSALVLAIMPWHIHISRVESEAIVATLFMTLGSHLAFKAFRKKSLPHLVWAAILFGLTFYTYHGNHISSTLLIVGFAAFFHKEIQKIKYWHRGVAIFAVLVAIILSITFSADHTKISGISIFGNPTIIHERIELPRLTHDDPSSLWARLQHNRLTYAARTIFQNYLLSYGPQFLFISGGTNSAHNISGYGNLHPIDAIFLLFGTVALLMAIHKKEFRFILWWVGIGAVAASITKDAPHSNRMLFVVPALAITIALGLYYAYQHIPKFTQKIALLAVIFIYGFSLMQYSDQYFYHFPKFEADNWGYPYKKLAKVISTDKHKNKNIVMTRPEASPYIYLLFYSAYDLGQYQKEATRYPITSDGFTDVSGFGRFSFRKINWDTDPLAKNTLLIMHPDEVHASYKRYITSHITLPNNSTAFVIIDTQE